jgi:hypothetical protein
MAMKETKFIQVGPREVERKIILWRSFGWEMVGAPQEIKTQDVQTFTGQDSDGTEHYQTKSGEHYVKLTFERDPARQNYAELKSLEEQYYGIKEPSYPDSPILFGCLWIILSIVGFFLFIVPAVVIITWRIVRYVKMKKVYNEDLATYHKEKDAANKKRQELLVKAQALV